VGGDPLGGAARADADSFFHQSAQLPDEPRSRVAQGQVFLWKQDQTWEDLWDLDGAIEP
jgi:hypothetical protein